MKLRRSLLYVPGNNPGMIKDAGIYGADCILFDLEDSVSITEKDAARCLVAEALQNMHYGNCELFVRINDPLSALGKADLEAIVPLGKANIRLPKTESARDILVCDEQITALEEQYGLEVGSTKMMAAVESAEGVLNAREIAKASPRMVAIAIGGEDYTADLKTARTKTGEELLFGRNMVLLAARSAGIDAIDTVFSDINDEEGYLAEIALIKQLGFDGKSVINPRQIRPLHQAYEPTKKEIRRSLAIVDAIEEARKKGSGVVSLNGKMIDRPVVLRAQRLLELAGPMAVQKVREEDETI